MRDERIGIMKEIKHEVQYEVKHKNKKSLVKYFVTGGVILALLGGVAVFAFEMLEAKQEVKAQQVQTQMIQNETQAAGVNLITEEEAKQLALDTVGVQEGAVKQLKIKLDKENGHLSQYVYEVSFIHDGLDYEIEVDALTKAIVNSDVESVID